MILLDMPFGDQLLKKVGRTAIRLGIAGRMTLSPEIGGMEFVVLLPETEASEAEQIIKRINDLLLKEKVVSLISLFLVVMERSIVKKKKFKLS